MVGGRTGNRRSDFKRRMMWVHGPYRRENTTHCSDAGTLGCRREREGGEVGGRRDCASRLYGDVLTGGML